MRRQPPSTKTWHRRACPRNGSICSSQPPASGSPPAAPPRPRACSPASVHHRPRRRRSNARCSMPKPHCWPITPRRPGRRSVRSPSPPPALRPPVLRPPAPPRPRNAITCSRCASHWPRRARSMACGRKWPPRASPPTPPSAPSCAPGCSQRCATRANTASSWKRRRARIRSCAAGSSWAPSPPLHPEPH
jgi:hypothetical protein